MKAFLFVAALALGFGNSALAATPASVDLDQNLISVEQMDRLLAEASQDSQLAYRGDRRYRRDGRHGRHGYYGRHRGGYYGYGYYPRHRYYDRHRYYGPKYRYKKPRRHYRW